MTKRRILKSQLRRREIVTKAKTFTFQWANRIGIEKFILISINDMFAYVVSFSPFYIRKGEFNCYVASLQAIF